MLPSYAKKWLDSSKTSSGWSSPTNSYATSWSSCSPLLPSRRKGKENLVSFATTPGIGAGPLSTTPLFTTLTPKPCNSGRLCGASSSLDVMLFGPVRASKADIKDGFYRLFLRALDCLRLAILLPKYDGEPQLVGIPMACTMGWVQSPPTFCTMSETICDEANRAFQASPTSAPPHRLEEAAAVQDDLSFSSSPRPREPEDTAALLSLGWTLPTDDAEEIAPPSNCPLQRPAAHTDVFVDDFIQVGQGGPKRMHTLRRHLLHSIDKVLATPASTDPDRNEAVSEKKMRKGDGSWATRKVLLGWVVDFLRQTLELPPHRKLELGQIFADLASRKRISKKMWERILGKLRFVSIAIPGSAGLFSALQHANQKACQGRIRITQALRTCLNDFAALTADVGCRPTHLAEIIPQDPTLMGTTDAAKPGMGGIYFDPNGNSFVWRSPFPQAIQDALVSTTNPQGSITNSDLEHTGLLTQSSLMCTTHNLRYATIANLSDNTPAVSRKSKGAVSSPGPASNLCSYQCAHQRLHRYCEINGYIPGPLNCMSDDASRLQHLSDAAFLSHFNQHYPQPKPWRLLHVPDSILSMLHSSLLCTRPNEPLLTKLHELDAVPSITGPPSVKGMGSPHPSVVSLRSRTSSVPNSASLTSSPMGPSTATKVVPTSPSELIPFLGNSARSARASPTWVSLIPGSTHGQDKLSRSTPSS